MLQLVEARLHHLPKPPVDRTKQKLTPENSDIIIMRICYVVVALEYFVRLYICPTRRVGLNMATCLTDVESAVGIVGMSCIAGVIVELLECVAFLECSWNRWNA